MPKTLKEALYVIHFLLGFVYHTRANGIVTLLSSSYTEHDHTLRPLSCKTFSLIIECPIESTIEEGKEIIRSLKEVRCVHTLEDFIRGGCSMTFSDNFNNIMITFSVLLIIITNSAEAVKRKSETVNSDYSTCIAGGCILQSKSGE